MKTIWIVTENPNAAERLSAVLREQYAVCTVGQDLPDGTPDLFLLTDFSALSAFQKRLALIPERFFNVPFVCLSDGSEGGCILSADDIRRVVCSCVPREMGDLFPYIEAAMEHDPGSGMDGAAPLAELQSDIRRSYPTDENGAIQVTYDSFASIYRFVEKLAERSGQCVQTLLLTLVPKKHATVSKSILQSAMETLYDAVHITLRKNDVLTGCSSSQILVLLMDADDDGGHMAANRIINTFLGLYDYPLFDLHYDIRPIEPKV